MDKLKYSVSGDTDVLPIESEVGDYGYAKFLHDRWIKDPGVFNVVMYRHEGNKRVMLTQEELV